MHTFFSDQQERSSFAGPAGPISAFSFESALANNGIEQNARS
jgi:hypothetical protein